MCNAFGAALAPVVWASFPGGQGAWKALKFKFTSLDHQLQFDDRPPSPSHPLTVSDPRLDYQPSPRSNPRSRPAPLRRPFAP
eukprot:1026654-Pyramimonas_sp.AAC.1